MDVRPDIVRASFREACFLFARWEDALDAPNATLDDVADGVEDRLLGACEGVQLGGASVIDRLLLPALVGERKAEVSVATLLLARMSVRPLIDALVRGRVRRLDAFARGLSLTGARAEVAARVDAFAPDVQAAIVDACALGPTRPPPWLAQRVDLASPAVRCAMLRFAARWRPSWASAWAQWGMQRSHATVRLTATKLALLLGVRGASSRAVELVQRAEPGASGLLAPLAMRYGERTLPVVAAELARGRCDRDVLDALVCIGTPAAVDLCVGALGREQQARLAAAAIETITGVRVPAAKRDPSARLLRGSEALLPWPDVDAWIARWPDVRRELPPGVRRLGGRRYDDAVLLDALAHGPTRPRSLLASELDLRTDGRLHVDTRAWSADQRAQMDSHRAARAA